MFAPTTTLFSASSRRRSVAPSFCLVLFSLVALGCAPLDDEDYNPPGDYVPPTQTPSQPSGSSDGDDSGYGDDYEDYEDYDDGDYGYDDDSRGLAGGPGGCSDACHYAHDGECDDGGPGADFDECSLGTDCGDCGPR